MRPLLVGQAPGPNTRADCPLYPVPSTSAGGRLAMLMGLDRHAYLSSFDRVNVLYDFPGKVKKEDKFPMREARLAARCMTPLFAGRVVVLIGRNVATAFGHADMPWFTWRTLGLGPHQLPAELAIIPHPSGRCRTYNAAETREEARAFFGGLLEKVDQGRCLLPQEGAEDSQPGRLRLVS